jgi:cyclopropane fatty-acyl-phospholipid synthase-like methyltransferase
MSKPHSEACENNKAPILSVISRYFEKGMTVLEIGSYTTQHVQYFAEKLPGITWQPSDTPENMPTVKAGLKDAAQDNILPPLTLDVGDGRWPLTMVEGIFSANTLHIMPEKLIARFFRGAGRVLAPEGCLCVYGPFKYGGRYTSESNQRFDNWLKTQDSVSGIRDFEQVNTLAISAGMALVEDHDMPANNQLLVWRKVLNYFPV